MSYRVSHTPEFWAGYEAALRYLAEGLDNLQAAEALEQELDRAINRVATFPFSMQPYPSAKPRGGEYRCIDVKHYLAFYVVLGDTVEFRRFLPARANLPAWLDA